jgi:hypothetical protein
MNTGRTLGIAAPNLSYENVSLTSDINLGEFSTVVFQPWDVLKGASKLSSKDVHPIRTRIIALTEWVKLGNDIIVVLSRMPAATYHPNDSTRNSAKPLDLLDAPLFAGTKFHAVSGSRIEFAGPPKSNEFFGQFIQNLKYEYIIQTANIVPLLRVSGANNSTTAQIVAGYYNLEKGRVVLVPPLDASPSSEVQGKYLDALPGLLRYLESQQRRDLPDWIDRWQMASERSGRANIQSKEGQISALLKDIEHHRLEIARDRWLLNLFAETGDAFASAVKTALVELGISVVDGPHPRADLLLNFNGQVGVVEAKGGGTREGDQL